MIQALRSLRRQSRSLREDRAIAKLIGDRRAREQFSAVLQSEYGWDGSTISDLFKIFLEHLPEIIALILRLVA